MSITVYKRVRGFYKGSKKRSKVLKEGIIEVKIQGLKVGGSIKVYIYIYYTSSKLY